MPRFLLLLLLAAPASAGPKELSADEFLSSLPALLETAPEPPPVTEAQIIELEEGDPQTYIFIQEGKAHPPAPVNLGGDGTLTLVRQDTGEGVKARYRARDGSYIRTGLDALQRAMRCGATGRETEMAARLLEILDAVEDRFGSRGLLLLSGYRSPRHNRRVKGAARWSLHMLGWAADIRVPGRTPLEVAQFAARLGAGGVGLYNDMSFVHLDAGRSRTWEVKKPEPPVKSTRTAR